MNTHIQIQTIKKITFSPVQTKVIEYKSSKLGLTFQEYIRHLVTKDTEDLINEFEVLNANEIDSVDRALDDVKKGKTYSAKNKKELKKLLDSWK